MTAPHVQVIQMPFLICPAVQIAAPAVFPKETGQAFEEMAQLARNGFAWVMAQHGGT